MQTTFSEIVVEGRFMLVKGFLLGFLSVKNPEGKYFFHRKAGIRRETFKDFLKEFFELDNYVHLCLEDNLVKPFVDASKLYTKITGNAIKSIRPIKSANFTFAFEVFNQDAAKDLKNIIENIPEGVELTNFFPYEEQVSEGKGTEAYAPLHEYVYRAKGMLSGDFASIMDIYLNLKRSKYSESIICSDVKIELGEPQTISA